MWDTRSNNHFITIIVIFSLFISETNVDAYMPSVHPHEKDIVSIKPILKKSSNKVRDVTTDDSNFASVVSFVAPKVSKKRWGTDYEHPEEYWFDDRIHTLGNHGFGGAFHAALAPLSTKIIDVAAYHGVDVRLQLAQELSEMVGKQKARVLDLCCGVGISTRALQRAFPEAEAVIGVDTSKQMVAMADFLTKHLQMVYPFYETSLHQISDTYKLLKKKGYAIKRVARNKTIKFLQGNAERTNLPDQSFDLVTVMWAFHEAPLQGRANILNEARRLLSPGGVLAVIDISTDYVPSDTMLKGEPYVTEYQQNIHHQLSQLQGFNNAEYRTVVENHLGMWTLTRTPSLA